MSLSMAPLLMHSAQVPGEVRDAIRAAYEAPLSIATQGSSPPRASFTSQPVSSAVTFGSSWALLTTETAPRGST
jgi:hypothetical protein